jgi:tetratricopeptide (TPR) repeat protein
MIHNINSYLVFITGVLYCFFASAMTSTDTTVVNDLLRHGQALHYSDPDSALFYYRKIIEDIGDSELGQGGQYKELEKQYLETIIKACNFSGNIYYFNDEYSRAEDYYQHSLEVSRLAGLKEYTAQAYYDLGYIRYVNNNFSEALNLFGESYTLHEMSGSLQGMFDAMQASGLAQRHLGNSVMSDSCSRQALELAIALGDSSLIADVRLNNGILLCEQGSLEQGILYFKEALSYYERTGDQKAVSLALLNIGVVMKLVKEYDKALSYILRSTEIEEALQQKSQLVVRYYNLADLYMEMGRHDLAYKYCKKTQAVGSEIGSRPFESECHFLLGKYYFLKGDFTGAEHYLTAACDSAKRNNNKPLLTNSMLLLAHGYLEEGKTEPAIKFGLETYRLATDLQMLIVRKDAAEILAGAYEQCGNHATALAWYKTYQAHSDSINYTDQLNEISRIEAKYNFEKKEKENELLRDKTSLQEQKLRNRNLIALALLAIVILSLVLIMQMVRRSRDSRLLFRQQQMLNLEHLGQLEKELEGKNRELISKMMFLNQKNDMIFRLILRLQEIRDSEKNSSEEILSIVNELRIDAPQSNWKEFEVQFIQVHPGFYQRLFERHPSLTSYEQRICAFLRMNLNTKEITSITGRSYKSIEVTRSRIRTKLGLKHNENLSSYLAAV